MKKTRNYFWPLKPFVTILLFCGLAFPAFSFTAERIYGDDLPGSVAEQQQIKVTGTITDASTGEAMIGVNIQVKGTTVGAISDASGKFTLNVTDQNATLVVSFIGYVTQEIALSGKTEVTVALSAELSQLNEVVVVGYGTQRKVTATGSVVSTKGNQFSSHRLPTSPTTL